MGRAETSRRADETARSERAPLVARLVTERYLSDRELAIVTALISAFLLGWILHFGMIQFPGEDGGLTAQAGWALHLGARPYIDLLDSGYPPLYLFGVKWAMALAGVSWHSIVEAMAVFAAASFAAQVAIMRRARVGTIPILALAVATQLCTTVMISFWWYNQITTVAAVLFFWAVVLFIVRPEDIWSAVILGACAVLLSWGKANDAAIVLLGTGVIFLVTPKLRKRGLITLVVAAVVSAALLVGLRVNLGALLGAYLIGASRVGQTANTGGQNANSFVSYMFLTDMDEAVRAFLFAAPAALAALAAGLMLLTDRRRRSLRILPIVMLAVLSLVTCILALGTNNDLNISEMPLVIMGSFVMLELMVTAPVRGNEIINGTAAGLVVVSLVLLSASGVVYSANRLRIKTTGIDLFYQHATLNRMQKPAFFQGVLAGPALPKAMGEIDDVLSANRWVGDRKAPVFLCPGICSAYPAFGIEPPAGIPMWWMTYPDSEPRTAVVMQRLEAEHPHIFIMYRGDHAFFPWVLLRMLYKCHKYTYKDLALFVPADVSPAPVMPAGSTRVR